MVLQPEFCPDLNVIKQYLSVSICCSMASNKGRIIGTMLKKSERAPCKSGRLNLLIASIMVILILGSLCRCKAVQPLANVLCGSGE